jgi:hypothetical protein
MSNPFQPCAAATVNIDVSSSSQRVLVAAQDVGLQVRIQNNGTATVWLNAGDSTVTAALASGFPVGPGVTEVLTFDASASGLYIAAIAAAATGKIYFTPGIGI